MKTQVIIDDEPYIVNYSINKPIRGDTDSLGVPLEPDEPGGVEIYSITNEYTNEDVSDNETLLLKAIEYIEYYEL